MATTTPPLTPMVDWISAATMAAGLDQSTYRRPYRGAVEVRIGTWSGPAGTFGGYEIGLISGRVLRGWLRNGNNGHTTRYNTGRDLLQALHQLHPAQATSHRATYAADRHHGQPDLPAQHSPLDGTPWHSLPNRPRNTARSSD